MRIFYDEQCFMQKHGGISRYFTEIIHNVPEGNQISTGVILTDNAYYSEYYPSTKFFLKKHFPGKRKLFLYINRIYCIIKMLIGNYDILHVTGDWTYFFKFNRRPFVITIHDMSPEILYTKENWITKDWIERRKKLIYKSTHIIAISHNTKKDLLKIYPEIPESKISVVYHGSSIKDITYGPNQWGNYILYVGKRSSYKNYKLFVSSIADFLKEEDLKLICTSPLFTANEKEFHESLGISSKVLNIEASNDLLNDLYHYAKLFVFPSKMEGFGIPILEAWSNNCPIALSNASCLPEIAGEAAVYFDPDNSESIKEQIISLYLSEEKRNQLVKLGAHKCKEYTWKNASICLFDVYNRILK